MRLRDHIILSEYDVEVSPREAAGKVSLTAAMTMDSKLPGKLLEMNVETGPWSKLKASVEDIVLHAAFMVCPNVPKESDDVEDPLTVREMGHAAFKAYIRTLQRAPDELKRRELTRSRFRAALILATPFSLKLQSEGTYTVQDLITVNLPNLKMPPVLQGQIEALLTVAIAQASNAKSAKTSKNYESADKSEFDVPMIYDPKFQRGPFDPYGRPPRLSGLSKLFIKKKSQNVKVFYP